MSKCREYEAAMGRLLSEEIGEADLGRLLDHVESCRGCEALFELHRDLESPELALGEPQAADLLEVRRAVLRTIRRQEPARDRVSWFGWRLAGPLLATGGAAAFLAIGFLSGRAAVTPAPAADEQQVLAGGIQHAAMTNRNLNDSFDSPYVYSNMQLRETGRGQVALSFDVSTHMELIRDRDDPLVTEVLVQAMLQENAVGSQLKAIDNVSDLNDQRVREALTRSMLDDPSLPVRLRALTRLSTLPPDEALKQAMLRILAEDDAVQMRLLAIDYLTENHVAPAELESVMALQPPGRGQAMYTRVSKYLEDYQ